MYNIIKTSSNISDERHIEDTYIIYLYESIG